MDRIAFGKPLANLGGNRDIIANARMAIDQARLLTLKAAWALDTKGTFGALTDISAIKVIAPPAWPSSRRSASSATDWSRSLCSAWSSSSCFSAVSRCPLRPRTPRCRNR